MRCQIAPKGRPIWFSQDAVVEAVERYREPGFTELICLYPPPADGAAQPHRAALERLAEALPALRSEALPV